MGGPEGALRVLVTGGGGFLGGAIVRRLLARGDSVRSLARGDYPALRELGVETLRGNLADHETVKQATEGCDAVFHVAAKANVWGPRKAYEQANVVGTRNVVDACRAEGVSLLVFTSSPSVVFNGRDMEGVNESVPYAALRVAVSSHQGEGRAHRARGEWSRPRGHGPPPASHLGSRRHLARAQNHPQGTYRADSQVRTLAQADRLHVYRRRRRCASARTR